MDKLKNLSVDELCDYLEDSGIEKSLRDRIHLHKIDGAIFASLSDDDLKELAPLIGDRVALKNLMTSDATAEVSY